MTEEKKNSSITYQEIFLQPRSFDAANQAFGAVGSVLDALFTTKFDEVIFTGCGTSLYLAQSAAFVFSFYNGIPAKAVCCSELYYYPDSYVKGQQVLVIPVTRKSITTEVKLAIEQIRKRPGVQTLSITCDQGSREYNDFMMLSPDADEDSVVMTRSFTSMLYLSVLLAMYVGGKRNEIKAMEQYGEEAGKFLEKASWLAEKVMKEHQHLNLYITLGQGIYYGVANECMNKMKEMGIANSEAYHTLEYRHGPMSLVDPDTLIVVFSSLDTRTEDIRLIQEMKAYGAVTVAAGIHAEGEFCDADYQIDLPECYHDVQNAPMAGLIGQMIGYYIAEKKGLDADTPRHLSQAIVID